MIDIRELNESDLKEVIALKIECWTEELAGRASNTLSDQEELSFWSKWYQSAEENNDIRVMLGAFIGDEMLGVAIGSLADSSDIPKDGIELNGLWVYRQHRSRGVSLKLLDHLLTFYRDIGKRTIVIYNLHHSPSNGYYRKLGCRQVDQVYQIDGKLLVDIFNSDVTDLLKSIGSLLNKYA